MAVDTVKQSTLLRLGFAIETTTGTDETLDPATAAALVIDPTMGIDQPGIAIPNMAGYGNKKFLRGVAKCTPSFSDYMTGIGEGVGIHDKFLLACGAVNAGGVYSFTKAAGGTATIGKYTDGLLDKGVGCVGNCVFTIKPGEPVLRKFDFQGAYVGRTDVAIPSPVTDPTLCAPQCISATITIGGAAYTWDEMTIDLGNKIIMRPSAASATGIKSFWIVDRNSTLTVSPEALAIATKDWGDLFGNKTTQTAAFSALIGADTGNKFTFAGTLALTKYPGLVDQDGRLCTALEWEFVDESLTITHA